MWRRLLSRRLLPLRSSALAALMTVGVIAIQGNQLDAQQPPNRPVTGTPTLSGTVRVGEFLTAHTSDIADEDGLSNVSFSYGWLLKPVPENFNQLRLLYQKRRYLVPPDAAGRTIQVSVAFRDDRGNFESVLSAPTAVVAPTVPDPPRNLAVASGGSGALSVEWEAPVWSLSAWLFDGSTDVGDGGSPITGYTVQWREDTDSWSDPADVSEAVVNTGTTYTIVGLTDGVTYAVRVIAGNALGNSEPSAEATSGSQLDAQQPPNRPVTGTPTLSGTVRVGEFLTAHTSDIADEDGLSNVSFSYGWVIDPPPDPYNVLRNLYSKSSYLVPPDAAGRTIWTAVGFRDDRGTFESVVSAPTAVVAPTVPDPPRNLAVASGGSGALSVEWEAPVWDLRAWLYDGSTDVGDGGSPITGYTVQWREDTDSWSNPPDVSEAVVNTGTTYTIVGLTDGVTYAVRVIAGNQVGSGEPSADAAATSGARPSVNVGPTASPGGSGSRGPTPSEADYEWTVEHDIAALDGGNDEPTGLWSNGETLWLADNPNGAGDAVYAYDLESGERVPDREFELDERNRAPRGIWSNRATVWVSDSGQEKLFAHDLASGERLPDSDLALHPDNDDPRGIWSDGSTMWVLDDRDDALFAYDLASGNLLAEYGLDSANDDPHGIWSDGFTVWVSNHDPKRLFAYRLPVLPDERTEGPEDLGRVRDEEFSKLSGAGNNSPGGIWSDGGVMYVADANDAKVYSYNMPDAFDARLASLALEGVDFGEFSPLRYDYASDTIPHGNIATLTATPAQPGASVEMGPTDHDGDPANGLQVRLIPGREITVTVASPDGSRMRVYRLLLGDEEAAGPARDCLRNLGDERFSPVAYEGGSMGEIEACARSLDVISLYALDAGGKYVSYILDAPEFVNRAFVELFPDGVPADASMIARRDAPSPTPVAGAEGS